MTLADLAAIDLDDRAFCLVVAAARRSRPRVSPRVMLERLIAAITAEPREVARLMCSGCERVSPHVHAGDFESATPRGRHVARFWKCAACSAKPRQFGGGIMIDEESAA